MNKKKTPITNNLWWFDYSVLGLDSIKFKYYKSNNIFYLKLINYYYFFLIIRYNLHNMFFYTLDLTLDTNKYYISIQTLFYDLQLLLEIKNKKYIISTSQLFFGNIWSERELKEFNNVFIINLLDNRKLLSNYNYNSNLEYNHFNNIINDIKI